MVKGMRRLAASTLAVLVAATLATGCAPEPAPTPTPTGFASEEEAFAAAEATYRAYVDAVNERRSNPESTPDPSTLLAGRALEVDIDANRQLEASGLRIEGPSTVASVTPRDASDAQAEVVVCLDSSMSRLIDAVGNDLTPPDRVDVIALAVTVAWARPSALITQSAAIDAPC